MTKNELPEFRNLELPAKRDIKNPSLNTVQEIGKKLHIWFFYSGILKLFTRQFYQARNLLFLNSAYLFTD